MLEKEKVRLLGLHSLFFFLPFSNIGLVVRTPSLRRELFSSSSSSRCASLFIPPYSFQSHSCSALLLRLRSVNGRKQQRGCTASHFFFLTPYFAWYSVSERTKKTHLPLVQRDWKKWQTTSLRLGERAGAKIWIFLSRFQVPVWVLDNKQPSLCSSGIQRCSYYLLVRRRRRQRLADPSTYFSCGEKSASDWIIPSSSAKGEIDGQSDGGGLHNETPNEKGENPTGQNGVVQQLVHFSTTRTSERDVSL